jgi:hypothetical protein
MRKDHRSILIALPLLGVLLTGGLSPTYASGPTFCRFGIGDLVRYGHGRIDAMGGAGIALLDDGFINGLNPAGLTKISLTRISGGFEYSSFYSNDGVNSSRYSRGTFEGVSFAIPIAKSLGITMLMESTPLSSVNYSIEQKDTVLTQDFYGAGGLSLLSLGGSVSPLKNLSLGLKFNYVFGRIEQVAKFTFADPSFTNSQVDRSDYYSGFTFTLGSIYEGVGELLKSSALKPLSLGFVLTTPAVLSVTHESILTTSASTDTTAAGSGKVDLPLALGVGASYALSSRITVTGDLSFENWGSSRFFGSHPANIRNSTRLALGVEAQPLREVGGFWSTVAYRAGIYYHSTYYKINNQPIDEWFVTGGLGIPIGPDARLNVGLHAGIRGTTSANLQRDTIFRLSFSLSASEAWFLKIEEE